MRGKALAARLQSTASMGIHAFVTDLRFAVRLAGRSPAAALLAILSLALGIGANTAVFSLIDTLVLRPLPVAEPDRLFQVAHGGRGAAAGDQLGRRDSARTISSIRRCVRPGTPAAWWTASRCRRHGSPR